MIGNSPKIGNILSFAMDAVIATSYADNYAVIGKAFQIRRRITLTSLQTIYFILDTTPLIGSGLKIATLPFLMRTDGGAIFLDLYKCESYTGGTQIPFSRINDTVNNDAQSIFKTGVTPIGTPGNDLREYIVGVDRTIQAAGGGNIEKDIPKFFTPGDLIAIKLVNQENANTRSDYDLTIYEI